MSLVSADYGSDEEDNTVSTTTAPPTQPSIQPAKENKFQNNTKINTEETDAGKKRKINFVVPLKVITDTDDDEDEVQRPQKKQKIGASLAQLLPKPKQHIEDKPTVSNKSSTFKPPSPLLGQYDSSEEDAEENPEEKQIQPTPIAIPSTTNNIAPIKAAIDERSAEESPVAVKKPTVKSAPKQLTNLRAQMVRAINAKSVESNTGAY